jgi:hypothetical protein
VPDIEAVVTAVGLVVILVTTGSTVPPTGWAAVLDSLELEVKTETLERIERECYPSIDRRVSAI